MGLPSQFIQVGLGPEMRLGVGNGGFEALVVSQGFEGWVTTKFAHRTGAKNPVLAQFGREGP